MYDVNFSIGVSTFKTDENLFRLRHYISMVYQHLRPDMQIPVYNDITTDVEGYIKFQGGTGVMPMSRALTRPWQYVQANGLLEPGFGET